MIVRTSLLEWKQTKRSNLALQWSSLIFSKSVLYIFPMKKILRKFPTSLSMWKHANWLVNTEILQNSFHLNMFPIAFRWSLHYMYIAWLGVLFRCWYYHGDQLSWQRNYDNELFITLDFSGTLNRSFKTEVIVSLH